MLFPFTYLLVRREDEDDFRKGERGSCSKPDRAIWTQENVEYRLIRIVDDNTTFTYTLVYNNNDKCRHYEILQSW